MIQELIQMIKMVVMMEEVLIPLKFSKCFSAEEEVSNNSHLGEAEFVLNLDEC